MNKLTTAISFFLSLFPLNAESPLDSFLNKYSDPIYQDIVINNDIFPIGSDYCEPRYHLFKPILDLYSGSFSVLDLGAAQGYFSFRMAHDYPKSSIVMVESNNTAYYAHHGDMLYDLCLFNAHLPNIIYLNKRMDVADLTFLNAHEHFDVIIAFLVVHLMEDSLKKQAEILNSLLSLSDNLILEVANDVGVTHSAYVEYLCESLNGEYLGEVKRHKDPHSESTGKLFWFKSKKLRNTTAPTLPFIAIQKETFLHLNGLYPTNFMQTKP